MKTIQTSVLLALAALAAFCAKGQIIYPNGGGGGGSATNVSLDASGVVQAAAGTTLIATFTDAGTNAINSISTAAAQAVVNTNITTVLQTYADVTNGSDITGNGNVTAPWKTLQHAQGLTPNGWTLNLAPGMYSDTITNIQINYNLPAGVYVLNVDYSQALTGGTGTNFIWGKGVFYGTGPSTFGAIYNPGGPSWSGWTNENCYIEGLVVTNHGITIGDGANITLNFPTFVVTSFSGDCIETDPADTNSLLTVNCDNWITAAGVQSASKNLNLKITCADTVTYAGFFAWYNSTNGFLKAQRFLAPFETTTHSPFPKYDTLDIKSFVSTNGIKFSNGINLLGDPMFNIAPTGSPIIGSFQVNSSQNGNGLGLTNIPPTALNAGTTFNNVDIPTNALGTHGYSGFMTNGVFVSTGTY